MQKILPIMSPEIQTRSLGLTFRLLSLLMSVPETVVCPSLVFPKCVPGHNRSLSSLWSAIVTDDNSFRPHPWGALMRRRGWKQGQA